MPIDLRSKVAGMHREKKSNIQKDAASPTYMSASVLGKKRKKGKHRYAD